MIDSKTDYSKLDDLILNVISAGGRPNKNDHVIRESAYLSRETFRSRHNIIDGRIRRLSSTGMIEFGIHKRDGYSGWRIVVEKPLPVPTRPAASWPVPTPGMPGKDSP